MDLDGGEEKKSTESERKSNPNSERGPVGPVEIEEGEGEEGKTIRGPKAIYTPSKEEWDNHMRSHIPFRRWKQTRNTGKTFRVANGQEIPNQGETKIEGQSVEAQAMKITAQVAAITKPLAAANEMVDADNLIVMHKEGGMV